VELKEKCDGWGLKGTILLSTEGINLFVAGSEESIGCLLVRLREIPGLEGLEPKVSLSESQPFNRMLVRLKKEIISFGVEGVEPGKLRTRRGRSRPFPRIRTLWNAFSMSWRCGAEGSVWSRETEVI